MRTGESYGLITKWMIYRVYLKYLDKLQTWVRHTKTRKKVHINVCSQTLSFLGTIPTFTRPQTFLFLSVGTLKPPSVFSSYRKWRDSSQTHFLCLSNYSQTPRDFWKRVSVHNQRCPWVHWFRWRTSGTFVVNCALLNNNHWKVIKLTTCTVNVLRQL
jgi:hypothetical protein